VDVSLVVWGALVAAIVAMLAVDLFLHRDSHVVALREAALWSGIWVAVAIAAGAAIWWAYGSEFGLQYFGGYLIEKSLAVDNVFVWAILLSYFAVPARYQHRVLFYGVIGALVFRAIFIAGGSWLLSSFSWVLYIFGAFLALTGARMLVQRNQHIDPAKSRILRLFRRLVPTTDEYDGQKFWTVRNGRRLATPLLAVLVVIEATDVLFSIDSLPAVFAVTQEPFLVFASNAMAILGLRAMYFLLAGVMDRFVYLKAGLALVLVWVGAKMVVSHAFVKIPTALSLGVVVAILATAIIASLLATKRRPTDQPDMGIESDPRDDHTELTTTQGDPR
jgi:tellurite resistance protein TerC